MLSRLSRYLPVLAAALLAQAVQAETYKCSSKNYDYTECEVGEIADVLEVRQLSKSRCKQGHSWGVYRRGVWVDHGCRAEFHVVHPHRAGRGADRVRCVSRRGRYEHCEVALRGRDVQLERQLSRAACRRGDSWGVDRHGIWVDRGCGAEFLVERRGRGDDWLWDNRPDRRPPPPKARPKPRDETIAVVTCKSRGRRLAQCDAPVRGNRVELHRQLSRSDCVRDRTWGVSRGAIWVDDGCRGEFHVIGERRHAPPPRDDARPPRRDPPARPVPPPEKPARPRPDKPAASPPAEPPRPDPCPPRQDGSPDPSCAPPAKPRPFPNVYCPQFDDGSYEPSCAHLVPNRRQF